MYIYICTRKTSKKADSRSQFPLATSTSVPSFEVGIFLPKNNTALQYSVSTTFRARARKIGGFRSGKNEELNRNASMQKTAPRNKRSTRYALVLPLPPLPRFFFSFLFFFHSFSPLFTPTWRLLFRLERISTIESFRWFSEIAKEAFLSIFVKSLEFPFPSIRN